MVCFIWILWFANQFLNLIILLNFLIAIISQSYDNVMSKSLEYKYNQRCQMNRECRLILKSLGMDDHFQCMILSANCSQDGDGEQWQGFVQTIKISMRQEISKLKKAISRAVRDDTQAAREGQKRIRHQVKSEMNEMKEKSLQLQAQMKTTKAKIEGVQADIKRELRGASTTMKSDLTLLKKAVLKAVGGRKI